MTGRFLTRYSHSTNNPADRGFFISGDRLMSFFHGVTMTAVDTGARTISLPTSSIIGLVDTFTEAPANSAKANDLVLITSEREAIAAFGPDSAITKACQAIYVRARAVIVACGVAKLDDAASQTSAIIGGVKADGSRTGLQALLDGKSRFNAQPRLLIAPKHSSILAVGTAMAALADKLRALPIFDGPNTTDEAVMAYAKNFGGKRSFMVDPGVQYWDTAASKTIDAPGSAWVAGLFAWTDAEYGFWASPSNKEFVGITGTKRPIEFLDGDETCRANLLNNANIATIIRDDGYRLWGNRTLSSDPKWAFVTRVRTMDIVMDAILYGHKWAVDRSITATYIKDVTEGLQAFMRDLKNQGAIINFEVFADTELNTASQLEQGKVFWNIRFTDVPPAENPNFRVEVTNQWLTEVLDSAA
ncbi:Major tail sheath protein [Pseudomonas syringae pv. tomato]|nr:Major tail sheath protein [Pseudomonas syringae pv. tomato]RMQ74555.1 Major tail sheath protein [Pseudomonas syringae pv. tomato]